LHYILVVNSFFYSIYRSVKVVSLEDIWSIYESLMKINIKWI